MPGTLKTWQPGEHPGTGPLGGEGSLNDANQPKKRSPQVTSSTSDLLETTVRDMMRRGVHTEADIQSSIKTILLAADIGLDDTGVVLEDPMGDGTRRRIDIRFGQAIIETKRDLSQTDLPAALDQLAGYVRSRSNTSGVPFIGILTDGRDWRLYDLIDDDLKLVSSLTLSDPDNAADRLIVWLESALATKPDVAPTPQEIEDRLGVDSPAHQIDFGRLLDLYRDNASSSEVQLKRELWAKLLRTSFGAEFVDDEELFINHTLLVLSAEIIAHAAIGFDTTPGKGLAPTELLTGSRFRQAQIHGVVEEDFFDWVLEVEGGDRFVLQLARRISRFVWADVENDVLKILYESVIPPTERERLGEYYTPDWLADRVVTETIDDPLTARVADPSCGSGTFLFHAVRRYLAAAEATGTSPGIAAMQVCDHVVGMDIHPVAVTLARVTYLLAIGKDRLNNEERGTLSVPVFLGDSMQWEQSRDLLEKDGFVSISTSGEHLGRDVGGYFVSDDLVFPRAALIDAQKFNLLVTDMAERALDVERYPATDMKVPRSKRGEFRRSTGTLIDPIIKRHGFDSDANTAQTLRETFAVLRRLVALGRNHIWAYYVRNLVRPLWMSLPENNATHLVGNPPWLRYSKMTGAMQGMFNRLAIERDLASSGSAVTSQELSMLFVVRCTELYLQEGGRSAFVMPHGTMTRTPQALFRTGVWSHDGAICAAFDTSWDLQDVDTGFPMASCVIHFRRAAHKSDPMPSETLRWSGRLPRPDVPWPEAKKHINVVDGTIVQRDGASAGSSPYKKRFRNGATLYPRMLTFVTERAGGPLGAGAGRVNVVSRRGALDNPPWKNLPSLEGAVPATYVRDVHLGETILPFRPIKPLRAVLPVCDHRVLSEAEIASIPGLDEWWTNAAALWEGHKKPASKQSLLGNFDHKNKLSAQLPLDPMRVAYTKAGSILTAALLSDPEPLIDHNLYWAPVKTESEGHYLAAILNSEAILERVRPLQTVGLFGPRHFDKHIFDVPIPAFDPQKDLHLTLSLLGRRAAEVAVTVDTGTSKFQAARKKVRAGLAEDGVWQEIEAAVLELIPLEIVEAIAEEVAEESK